MKKTGKLTGEKKPRRIAILRALQLGDLMCAVPAFRALRRALPDAGITLVGLPWASSFVNRFQHYLDNFIEFPGFPGFPEQPVQVERIPAFLSQMQDHNFDLAIQMQGSGAISNSLVELLGAQRSAGFYLPGQYCPDEDLYTPYPVHISEVERNLQLVEFLGIPKQRDHKEFPIFQQDWEDFRALSNKYGLETGTYAVIHPGARSIDRRWPTAWFAAVADGLAERGLRIILTGTSEEAHIVSTVISQMRTQATDLSGKTSVGCLAILLNHSRLLVCNDTGISHIADALQIPSIVLFTASEPTRWAPHDQVLHRVIAWASSTLPDVVLDEADELLKKERIYVPA
jgi:ADP-heptose:LPS heptosyltransferase